MKFGHGCIDRNPDDIFGIKICDPWHSESAILTAKMAEKRAFFTRHLKYRGSVNFGTMKVRC